MRLPEVQLKETLKILAHEFVNSVEKMCSLHQENLLLTSNSSSIQEQQLYIKVLQCMELEKRGHFLDDCVKLLENSYEEKIKYECFEKDFSISVQNHSISKNSRSFEESDQFDHQEQHLEQGDERNKRTKRINVNRRGALQVTKYHRESNEEFCVDEKLHDCCKKQEKQFRLNPDFFDECSQEENSEENSESNISSYENSVRNSYNLKERMANSPTKFTYRRKKYRSYTEEQRQQAIQSANDMGIEFASRSLQIPKKNINRWMKRKQKSEKIRGRKPGNPSMEENLTNWLVSNIEAGTYLTQNQIRSKARYFSGDQNFKASKGWLQKYFRRNRAISDGINELLSQKRIVQSCRR